MDIDLPYLSRNKDRHGNVRLYVRHNGGYVRLRGEPGTPEFLAAYTAALERLGGPKDAPGPNAREQFGHTGLAGRAILRL